MIRKIVSGGQTGADRAALDVALVLGIEHGGWVPRGRLAEDGPLDARYRVRETASDAPEERTRQNVLDADGTLIVSRGPLAGGSATTLNVAVEHGRAHLHADLSREGSFPAAVRIAHWIRENGIEVLNVAGPRSGEDPGIYTATRKVLETVLHLELTDTRGYENPGPGTLPASGPIPATVEEAVSALESALTLKEKSAMARMSLTQVRSAFPLLAARIRTEFRLPLGNPALMDDCRDRFGKDGAWDPGAAVERILKTLWESAREKYRIRRVR